MEELKQLIADNRKVVFVALSVLLFVFVSFCPIIDFFGKIQLSGFQILFDGGIDIIDIPVFIMIVLQLVVAALNFIDCKGRDKWSLICYGSCFVIGLVFVAIWPAAFGSFVYLFLSLVAAGVAYLGIKD